MLVHGRIDYSKVNGPGQRAVLFLQGCVLKCPGCWNRRSHRFAGDELSIDELMDWVLACRATAAINGVTFSGGEPMHQAPELLELAKRLKAAAPDLSLGMFSGYSERELDCGDYWTRAKAEPGSRAELWAQLRRRLDFAVLGRFNQALPTTEPLRTSRNQALRLYSTRLTASDFRDAEVEVTIAAQGLVTITGFPMQGLPA